MAPAARIIGRGKLARLRHRNPAMTDVQVDGGIEFRIIKLVDHIRPDNADLRRTVRDKGRHVKGTHADNLHIRVAGIEHQCAAVLVKEIGCRFNTSCAHQRQRLVKDSSLGDCKDQFSGHDMGAL